MAQGLPPSDSDSDRPKYVEPAGENFYTVLSTGDDTGVYLARPPNTAIGCPLAILPIVVVTSDHDEAMKVHSLNKEILPQLSDPINYDNFKQLINGSRRIKTIFKPTRKQPIYAFKVGVETGIYFPYDWNEQLFPLTDFEGAMFKKFWTFEEALVWMIDKWAVQARFRTKPSGPAPVGQESEHPTRLTEGRVQEGASSRPVSPSKAAGSRSSSPSKRPFAPRLDVRVPISSPRAGSPTKREDDIAGTSISAPVGYARAGSPVKGADGNVAPSTAQRPAVLSVSSAPPTASSPGPFTPRRARTVAFAPVGSRSPDRARRVRDVPDDDRHRQPAMRPEHVMLDHLRQVLCPPESPQDFVSAVELGEAVEVWFRAHRLSAEAQLFILRAYIWTDDVSEFAGLTARPPLELALVDAEYLWGLITTWVVSL